LAIVFIPARRIAAVIKRTTLDFPRVPLTNTLIFILLRLREQKANSTVK
jgi:hypothetical protein